MVIDLQIAVVGNLDNFQKQIVTKAIIADMTTIIGTMGKLITMASIVAIDTASIAGSSTAVVEKVGVACTAIAVAVLVSLTNIAIYP
jgi:hypothetical protein